MKTQIYLFDDQVEITIDVEYDAFYQSARVSGPPEDCYPAEGELTVTSHTVVSTVYLTEPKNIPEITAEIVKAAIDDEEDRIYEECWDDFLGNRYEYYLERDDYESRKYDWENDK